MMREIKFRGKDGKWFYGAFVKSENHSWIIEENEPPQEGMARLAVYFDAQQVKPETVGQYSGLLDTNGKEIYEGDIVTVPGYGKWAVQWFGSGWNLTAYDEPAHEIIGNIYDNPELVGTLN